MTFQEQLRLLRKKQGVLMEDVLAIISLAVMASSTFSHDQESLIFASLWAGYLLAAIAIVAVKTRKRPSQPGLASVVLCGSTLVSIVTVSSLT